MKTKTLLWWFPASIIAIVAVVEGGMHMGARAAKKSTSHAAAAACATREVTVDLNGDGQVETVKLVRVGDDAWADVWSADGLRSSTRVGAWREDAALEALDINGDGKMDLIRRWAEGPEQHAQFWLSDGNAFDEGWTGITSNTCVASLAQR